MTEEHIEFRSLDGLRLRGTLTLTEQPVGGVVLVHGGGVTREEGGFFRRLAQGIAALASMTVLRFDLRGHGESEGRQEDLTLMAVANDIRAAADVITARTGQPGGVHLVGASFSGGISAMAAGAYPEVVGRLVLLNPLLDYKRRFVVEKPYWSGDRLRQEEAHALLADGFLPHSPTFKLGRPLLNEVLHVVPADYLGRVQQPTLIVHGTKDTFIPVESSRYYLDRLGSATRHLLEIDGAQHGIAMPDDPAYEQPQTRQWQASVVRAVADWLTNSEPRLEERC
ncbi:alpha/beta hydrolase [Streptomyces sp. LX-29]|uniref:alpha/beta hydrolase n=1 Tax=Streptomyces sp. LX-29 TaxID=2900152 RepID=UPI00240E28B7|nr:alpha/beta fold hydrolase [Streptomyces sp. LX-29]WFB09359.1 alpha/beta hydrolase [Streptomyces sp. LX-29]